MLDLLELAFGEREIFAAYLSFDPLYRPEDILLAVCGDLPVACVQIFTKRIWLRGTELKLGGIGSVATHPEFRRRGLASELLQRAEAEMRARDMHLALLFSGRLEFYERRGWLALPLAQVALHRSARPGSLPSGASLRGFCGSDLPSVSQIYDSYCDGMDGTALRSPDYWRGQLAYAGSPGERFLVAERLGEIAAYARGVRLEGVSHAMEIARKPGAADLLAGLLVELCPKQGALLMRMPRDPELELALTSAGLRVDSLADNSAMWRALDRAALAKLARTPASCDGAELLRAVLAEPGVHYWLSDRF